MENMDLWLESGKSSLKSRLNWSSSLFIRFFFTTSSSEIQSVSCPASGMRCKVGKYVVYVQEFETLCLSLFDSPSENTLLAIDEIGKMELFSKKFEASIKQMLASNKNLKVLATVPMKSTESLVDQLKQSPSSQIYHITKSNRDEIYRGILETAQKLISWIKSLIIFYCACKNLNLINKIYKLIKHHALDSRTDFFRVRFSFFSDSISRNFSSWAFQNASWRCTISGWRFSNS